MENTSLTVAAPATRQPAAAGTLSAFSSEQSFVSAQRMATALCSSTLVPEAYRGTGNLGNALIALELSHRIGASVMAVMQSMTPIHGRPSWSAAFLIATVNTCGRFTPLRFRWQGQEGTDAWGCRAVAKERDSGEELVGSLITIALAKAEGWYGRAGSKWKTMPEQMLTYRAAAFWTRAYAPELSLGMVTSEEANDLAAVERRRGTVESVREQVAAIPAPTPAAPATVVVESTPVVVEPEPEPVAAEVVAEPVAAAPEPEPVAVAPTVPAGVPETVEGVLAACGITYEELAKLAAENAWWDKSSEYTEAKWLPAEVVAWILRNHRGIARAAKKLLAARKTA